MQQNIGFTKGMRQSISPDKADPQSYYEALNKRIIIDTGSGTASATDSPGTRLLITIPETKGVYTLESGGGGVTSATISFYTEVGTINVTVSYPGVATGSYLYNNLINNSSVQNLINNGRIYLGLSNSKVTVVFLNDTVAGLSLSGTGVVLTNVIPDIDDATIMATGQIRDTLIIFTKSGIYGQIWKCQYNSNGEIGTLNPYNNLVYNNIMYPDTSTTYDIIDIVGRHDHSELIKIYWTNSVDNINHINIATRDSLVVPVELLSITPDCDLSQPKVVSVNEGGMYYSGMVQYGYQLYNLNGAESLISPLSGLIHLAPGDNQSTDSLDYAGADNGVQVGKSVNIQVRNIDYKFDFIKIIAAYYTSQEGEPEVNVVYEGSIPVSRTINVIDSGDRVLSVYTPAQLNSIGNRVFNAKLLTIKDGFLIAGNITNKYFDVDEELGYFWDSRTYRFNSGGSSIIKYEGDNYSTVSIDFKIDGNNIPETHDCHIDKTSQETYKYTTSGNILGGSGPKISYSFFVRSINLDIATNPTKVITNNCGNRQKWGTPGNVDFIEDTYLNNNSFTNYASPINQSEIVGYQRNEIYRFGIVFFDGKGRQSFVKWIGDIKMPTANDTNPTTTYYLDQDLFTDAAYDFNTYFICNGGTGVYANALGIKFDVDTSGIPDDWKFAIVRARREDVDKTVLAQGTLNILFKNEAKKFYSPHFDYLDKNFGFYDSYGAKGMFNFFSPEFKFKKQIPYIGKDELNFINAFTPERYIIPESYPGEFSKFYKTGAPFLITKGHEVSVRVADFIQTEVSDSLQYKIRVNGIYVPVSNYGWGLSFDDQDDKVCYIGSNLLIGSDNVDPLGLDGQVIVNYERELSSQYGGFNYTAKQNTIYQLAGKVLPCTATSSMVYGGDTFIEIFDFLLNMLDINANADMGGALDYFKHKSCIYIPVETSINLALRHDTCPSKNYNAGVEPKLMETIQKGFEVWPDGNSHGAYPSELTDLYLYNTVYSKEPTGKTYVAKPLNFTSVQNEDCMSTSSERNISGELVDSWTKFLFNNSIKVNSANGALTKLHVFRNQVMFWQDKAFGIFSFNDRKVLSDPNGTQLVLGVGSVLEYFQYISEMSGTSFTKSVIDSGAALYWYDDTNHKMMMSQGGKEESISDIADMAPLFKREPFIHPYKVIGVFDKSTRQVMLTATNSFGSGITVGFNERLQAFESLYSFTPYIFISFDGNLLGVENDSTNKVYEFNYEPSPNRFFGNSPVEGYITVVVGGLERKVFTNVEFNSTSKNTTTEYPLDTVDSMKIENSYTSSAKISLTSSNLRRRFRTWRIQLPKDSEGVRYLDSYLKLTLFNTPANNSNIRLEGISVYYLIPML